MLLLVVDGWDVFSVLILGGHVSLWWLFNLC